MGSKLFEFKQIRFRTRKGKRGKTRENKKHKRATETLNQIILVSNRDKIKQKQTQKKHSRASRWKKSA